MPPNKEPISIDEAINIVQSVLSDYGITINSNYTDGMPPILLDSIAEILRFANATRSQKTTQESANNRNHKIRSLRVKLIQDLLETYREPFSNLQSRKLIRNRNNIDLDILLKNLPNYHYCSALFTSIAQCPSSSRPTNTGFF